MKRLINNRAFTLVEIMIAATIAVIVIGIVLGFYSFSNQAYSMGVSRQQLQDDANIILTKIIEGKSEPGGVFRLSEAVSYNIVGISELHFVGTDSIERWFSLDNSSTSIIYHHPTISSPAGEDETICRVPTGSTITLRFSIPSGAQYTGVVIGIDAAETKNVSGNTISGSASTYVNIRNHSV